MEFRHLQTVQAIAQEGSFLKAAEKLQYAQSTMFSSSKRSWA
jgi:LysR family transcriptional regulator, regulator of the ytmI operon